jgi:EPS-associated MarR family transcriptional regulator
MLSSCRGSLSEIVTHNPLMTSRRSKLQEDTYFRVLRILQSSPDLTQREIAQLLGVSTSGLNYCLNALIDKGWVKVHNFRGSKNKFGYVYLLTPSGIAEKAALTGRFIQRKLLEHDEMRAEIESLKGEGGEGSKGRDGHVGSGVPAGAEVSRVNNILADGV